MKLIQGITDQPKQQSTITLADGSKAVWTLNYSSQQLGWFWSLTWNGNVVANGQRLVASPNILRRYINLIPFGIAVITQGNVEPTAINDLDNGLTEIVLLEGDDLSLVEAQAFDAQGNVVRAIGVGADGSPVILPPDSWGPAGGDLYGTYPNPFVGAIHEQSGPTQLLIGAVADGQTLKRVGNKIVGGSSGTGDVVGPAGAVDGQVALFDGVTGKLLRAGPNLADGSGSVNLSIAKAARFSYGISTFSVAGAFVLNLSSTNRMLMSVVGNVVLSSAGFANEFKLTIVVKNPTGSAWNISWPGWSVASGALPPRIFPGASFVIDLEVMGTTEPEVWACLKSAPPAFGPGSYGDATHIPQILVDNQGRLFSLGVVAITAGDVFGPAGAVAGHLATFADATGKLLMDGGAVPAGGVVRGQVYPEDYGAVGNGVTNDAAALVAAAAATPAGSVLVLTQSYAIGSAITLNCDIMQATNSSIVPTAGYVGDGLLMPGGHRWVLGHIDFFVGNAITCNGACCDLFVYEMNGASLGGTAVKLMFNAIDSEVKLFLIGGWHNCVAFGGGMQGCKIYVVFATASDIGLNFDGSANGDSNECTFNSWDSIGAAAAFTRVFYNSNSSGGGNYVGNWKLAVENWIGFGSLTGSKFADGSFGSCRFYMGDMSSNCLFDWDYMNVPPNGANLYENNDQIASGNLPKGQWSNTANARAAFWPYTAPNNPPYYNSVVCTGAIPGGGIAPGAILTTYVYHPLAEGNTYTNIRAQAQSALGLVPIYTKDNHLVHGREIRIDWVNASNAAIVAGTTFDFIFVCGLP